MPASLKKFGFWFSLPAIMTSGTYALVMLGILAPNLIEEFSIHRWQVGLLSSVSSLMGGLCSPWAGRWTDRIGPRRAALISILVGASAILLTAGAFSYLFLFVPAAVSALSNAVVNPSTNKLISEHSSFGHQGVITGLKQSGVQFGAVISGLVLPPAMMAWGWRWAVTACTLFPLLTLAVGLACIPPDREREAAPAGERPASGDGLPPLVKLLAAYAFLLGMGTTSIMTYLPLYAEEELSFSATFAGAAMAVLGVCGMSSRILSSVAAERYLSPRSMLILLPGLAVAGGLLLAAAPALGATAIMTASALAGLGAVAWNAVAMLTVIQVMPSARAGQGTGLVLLGFLCGLGVGAPLFGLSVDVWGSYLPGWLTVTGLYAAGGALVLFGAAARPGPVKES